VEEFGARCDVVKLNKQMETQGSGKRSAGTLNSAFNDPKGNATFRGMVVLIDCYRSIDKINADGFHNSLSSHPQETCIREKEAPQFTNTYSMWDITNSLSVTRDSTSLFMI